MTDWVQFFTKTQWDTTQIKQKILAWLEQATQSWLLSDSIFQVLFRYLEQQTQLIQRQDLFDFDVHVQYLIDNSDCKDVYLQKTSHLQRMASPRINDAFECVSLAQDVITQRKEQAQARDRQLVQKQKKEELTQQENKEKASQLAKLEDMLDML